MKIISEYSVSLDIGAATVRVEIFNGGATTGLKIDAVNLLAQFELSNGDVLLVLDEDSPFEEMLHFCLLRQDQLIDHLRYGALYISGIFKLIQAAGDQLSFTFASDEVLRLSVDIAGSRWPEQDAPGASYASGVLCKRFLNLKLIEPWPRE